MILAIFAKFGTIWQPCEAHENKHAEVTCDIPEEYRMSILLKLKHIEVFQVHIEVLQHLILLLTTKRITMPLTKFLKTWVYARF